jgi:glycosyltransferase involved in cell wall biosynthesis
VSKNCTRAAKVSVVIPTKNRAGLLRSALTSVLNLSGSDLDIEVIVADDGSTDGTAAVAGEFGAKVVRTVGHGAAASRNAGLRAAEGDFIAFLDDDDVWLANHLRPHLSMLLANPDLAAVVGQAQTADADLNPQGLPWPSSLPDDRDCFRSFLIQFPQIGATVIRATVLDTVGPLDEALTSDEDWDWHLRLALRHRVGFVAVPCVLFRRRGLGTWDDLRWSRLGLMRHVYWLNVRRAGRRAPNPAHLARIFLRHNGAFADYFLQSAWLKANAWDIRGARQALARAIYSSPVHVARATILKTSVRKTFFSVFSSH